MKTRMLAPLLFILALACGAEEEAQPPVALSGVSPFRFPVALWDQGVQGQATLMVRVTDEGAVDSVYVEQSSGYAEFDSAALAGARGMRFLPARRGTRRITMWARVPVRFARDSAADRASADTLPTATDSAS